MMLRMAANNNRIENGVNNSLINLQHQLYIYGVYDLLGPCIFNLLAAYSFVNPDTTLVSYLAYNYDIATLCSSRIAIFALTCSIFALF